MLILSCQWKGFQSCFWQVCYINVGKYTNCKPLQVSAKEDRLQLKDLQYLYTGYTEGYSKDLRFMQISLFYNDYLIYLMYDCTAQFSL
jgi:hypothetical protein